jgi:hypothetical protein
MPLPNGVDPVRSHNTTVTDLRTSTGAGTGASLKPHSGQNFVSETTAPQPGHSTQAV